MAISIRRRLTFGTLFLFGLLLLCAGLGIFQLNRLKQDAQAVLVDNYESVHYVQAMQQALFLNNHDAFAEQLRLQEANITESDEADHTSNLRKDFDQWKGNEPVPSALQEDLNAILDLNLQAIDRKNEAALATAQRAQNWLWGIAALTLVVGLTFSLAFPRLITEPIGRLRHAVEEVARGNYRHRIPTFRSDELGALSQSFNEMSAELEQWESSNLALVMAEKSRVEAVLNSLQDAALGVDNEGRVLFANRKATELLGLAERELVGKASAEVMHRNDLLRHVLAEGEGRPFKAVIEGEEQFFASSRSPIRSNNGDLGTVYLLHNITPFQERDEAKTHFLATISHEMKTPLASTDLGLGLLERSTPPDGEQQAILHDLRKDHQRLVRIVSELLDMAQIETGRVRFDMQAHELGAIVHEAIDALRTTVDARGIRMDLRIDPSVTVRVDAEKGTWAVINLLSNALRYSPDQGTVTITSAENGGRVLLSIADQGPGLSDEQRMHLFERFAPRSGTGTGLGLSISRDLLRAMGGDIDLGATSGKGTEFIVSFAR